MGWMKLRNTMLAALLALPLVLAPTARAQTFNDYDYGDEWSEYYDNDAYTEFGWDGDNAYEVGDYEVGDEMGFGSEYDDNWFEDSGWNLDADDWWL
jgi:hypothetical protein